MVFDEQELFKLIATILKVDMSKIDPDLTVGDIPEWDSLAHINLFSAIEKQYQLTIEIDQAIELESVDDFIYFLSENLG
jgi:acyl carrier protein